MSARFYWRKEFTALWHAYRRTDRPRSWLGDNYRSACNRHVLITVGGQTRPRPPAGEKCGLCAVAVSGHREGSPFPR